MNDKKPLQKANEKATGQNPRPTLDSREEIRRICNHDINSPLTAILDCCKMLCENQKDETFGNELMINIHDAIDRVIELIDRVHILNTIQDNQIPFSKKHINLISCVQRVKKNLHTALKNKDIQLLIKSTSDQVFVDSRAFSMRGDSFTYFYLINLFIKTLIRNSPEGSNIMFEIIHGEDIGIRISGEGEIPDEMNNMSRYISNNGADMDISKLEWVLAGKLFIMTEGTLAPLIRSDDNYHIMIRFPIMKQQSKACMIL